MGQRLLLTGATGYLGGHVARRLLAGGHDVEVLVREISDRSRLPAGIGVHLLPERAVEFGPLLAQLSPSAVVHMAACVVGVDDLSRVDEIVSANLGLGTQLLAALPPSCLRFVNTGSFWERIDGPEHERAMNLYAASKQAFERILAYYAEVRGLAALTLRLFNTYGPADPRPKVFAHFERSFGAEEAIGFSPGEQRLDLLHVEDAAAAYEAALSYLERRGPGPVESFEIGSGESHSLREVGGLYAAARGRVLNVAWGARPYRPREVMDRCAELGPTTEALGWTPRLGIREGFAEAFGRGLL